MVLKYVILVRGSNARYFTLLAQVGVERNCADAGLYPRQTQSARVTQQVRL